MAAKKSKVAPGDHFLGINWVVKAGDIGPGPDDGDAQEQIAFFVRNSVDPEVIELWAENLTAPKKYQDLKFDAATGMLENLPGDPRRRVAFWSGTSANRPNSIFAFRRTPEAATPDQDSASLPWERTGGDGTWGADDGGPRP